jgi:hypothetical protein
MIFENFLNFPIFTHYTMCAMSDSAKNLTHHHVDDCGWDLDICVVPIPSIYSASSIIVAR